MSSVVVVAPHPDDEVIGCGGSIAKHADQGHRVTVVVVVERERSSLDEGVSDRELAEETEDACRVLGVGHCLRMEAPSRDLTPSRPLQLALVRALREACPEVVYLPHADEDDVEHRLVHQLGLEALWMAQSSFFPDAGRPAPAPRLVLGYEVWAPLPRFQYAERIDDTIERKLAAMRCYRSQLRHVDWVSAIRGLAAYRAALTHGSGYVEAFSVLRLQ